MKNKDLQHLLDLMQIHKPDPKMFEDDSSYPTHIVGYKILRTCEICERSSGKFILVSPQMREVHWEDGRLQAHAEPNQNSMDGIHFAKSPNYPGLIHYVGDRGGGPTHYMVRCVLSGTVIETEWGYRAQHAEIEKMIEVWNDYGRMVTHGDWKSYQEVAYTETRRIRGSDPQTEWEYKYRGGYPFIDPGIFSDFSS